ncbi:MAG: hypothetical protein GX061_08825 [Eubacteriaceae bacterium]|nr:hypothetical protein [Eubacteriaceae bacterium]
MNENYARKRIEEDFDPVLPDDNIICRDCMFRKEDLTGENGNIIIAGYKKAHCDIYTSDTRNKPIGILFKNRNCEYYEKERTE